LKLAVHLRSKESEFRISFYKRNQVVDPTTDKLIQQAMAGPGTCTLHTEVQEASA